MAHILKFTHTPSIDESIEEYVHHEYEPITGTSINNGGDIRISIEPQDMFTHPSESYLLFEGRLTKADGTPYANADEVALTNNATMHLFSRIEYHLSNQLIELLNYPGQATTMLGLLKYPDDFSRLRVSISCGIKTQQQLQQKPTTKDLLQGMHISSSHQPSKGRLFSFRIPLKHIFGICEDCDKIVFGLKHSLTLVRKTDDDAILRGAADGAGKVTLDKMLWFMPRVIPADAEKFSIYKTIESKVRAPVAYRTRQCDMLSVPESTSFTWRLSVKTPPE